LKKGKSGNEKAGEAKDVDERVRLSLFSGPKRGGMENVRINEGTRQGSLEGLLMERRRAVRGDERKRLQKGDINCQGASVVCPPSQWGKERQRKEVYRLKA